MAAYNCVDNALKVFGTPERVLRRRWLHPLGATPPEREETDDSDRLASNSKTSQTHTPLSSPTTSKTDFVIGLLFHLTTVAFLIYMKLERDKHFVRLEQEKGTDSDTYGGMWKFLSYLNFHAQAGYFILALTCDLLPWAKQKLQHFLDFIFTTTVFPCALAVTFLFWTQTVFFREYSVGAASDTMEDLPPYIKHAWHSAVGFAVLIEVLLVQHRYTSNSDAIKAMFIWNLSYALWVYWCFFDAGTLPYPLLYKMGPYFMSLFFVLVFIVSILFYFFGKALSLWSWDVE